MFQQIFRKKVLSNWMLPPAPRTPQIIVSFHVFHENVSRKCVDPPEPLEMCVFLNFENLFVWLTHFEFLTIFVSVRVAPPTPRGSAAGPYPLISPTLLTTQNHINKPLKS